MSSEIILVRRKGGGKTTGNSGFKQLPACSFVRQFFDSESSKF